jgi:hypothetical protein
MKIKVWNDNVYDHEERFKGKQVKIPAGEAIELDFEEAMELVSQFSAMPPEDYQGDVRRFHKKLRVDQPKHAVISSVQFIDPVTGKRYDSAAQLAAALQAHAHLAVKDEQAEEAAKSASRVDALAAKEAEIEALKAQLAALEEKRGPGRPKKVANG